MDRPWESEPDHLRWTSTAGLDCVINRSEDFGILCGYVRVTPGHFFYGVDYRMAPIRDVLVHGGLTFSDRYAPGEGDTTGEWWFGFDCGHAWDIIPLLEKMKAATARPLPLLEPRAYRDVSFVKAQCEGLAEQLVRMSKSVPLSRVVEA